VGDVGDQGMLGKIGPIGGKGKPMPGNFPVFFLQGKYVSCRYGVSSNTGCSWCSPKIIMQKDQ